MTTTPAAEPLPPIVSSPAAYAGCCLALSLPLLEYVRHALPAPLDLALSIGSGYGLLEALLLAEPYNTNIVGVEVEPSSNKYLPATNHRVVHGSRFLEPLAAEASAWLFVYPRRVGLVQQYLAEYGSGSVRRILWAGPKADWPDYADCFKGWRMRTMSADEVGGSAWELIAIADKTTA